MRLVLSVVLGSTQEPDDTDLRPKDVANDRAQLVRLELATQDPQASTVDRDLEWRQPLLARELAGEGRKRVRSRAPGIDAHVLDRLLPADLDPQALSTLGLFGLDEGEDESPRRFRELERSRADVGERERPFRGEEPQGLSFDRKLVRTLDPVAPIQAGVRGEHVGLDGRCGLRFGRRLRQSGTLDLRLQHDVRHLMRERGRIQVVEIRKNDHREPLVREAVQLGAESGIRAGMALDT